MSRTNYGFIVGLIVCLLPWGQANGQIEKHLPTMDVSPHAGAVQAQNQHLALINEIFLKIGTCDQDQTSTTAGPGCTMGIDLSAVNVASEKCQLNSPCSGDCLNKCQGTCSQAKCCQTEKTCQAENCQTATCQTEACQTEACQTKACPQPACQAILMKSDENLSTKWSIGPIKRFTGVVQPASAIGPMLWSSTPCESCPAWEVTAASCETPASCAKAACCETAASCAKAACCDNAACCEKAACCDKAACCETAKSNSPCVEVEASFEFVASSDQPACQASCCESESESATCPHVKHQVIEIVTTGARLSKTTAGSNDSYCQQMTELLALTVQASNDPEVQKRAITTALEMVARNAEQQADARIARLELEHQKSMAQLNEQLARHNSQQSMISQMNDCVGPLYLNQRRNMEQLSSCVATNATLSQTLELLEQSLIDIVKSDRIEYTKPQPTIVRNEHLADQRIRSLEAEKRRRAFESFERHLGELESNVRPAEHVEQLKPMFRAERPLQPMFDR